MIKPESEPTLKVLVSGASLRADSLNRNSPLAQAHKALVEGDIADVALRARFDKNLHAFLSLAEAAKHYPCMKRAWVEFLGEPPGAGADRIDPIPG